MDTTDFTYLTTDLKISAEIFNKLKNVRDAKYLKSLASTITNQVLDDSYILAGRLYMAASLQSTVKNVESYLKTLSHRLEKSFCDYMWKHQEEINSWIAINTDENYKNVRDYISANKWVHGNLLNAGFNQDCIESPEFQAIRLAVDMYGFETYNINTVLKKAKEILDQYYTLPSPMLFNAGSPKGGKGSCFLLQYEDDLWHIGEGVKITALITQMNGGTGINFTPIRHCAIGYTGEMSGGVFPYLKLLNGIIAGTNQGGKRPGASTAFLHDWHIDMPLFLRMLRSDSSPNIRIPNIQGCLWMHDLFYKRVKENGKWTLFCPRYTYEKLGNKYNDEFEEAYEEYEREAVIRKQEFDSMNDELKRLKQDYFITKNSEISDKIAKLEQEIAKFRKNRLINFEVHNARELFDEICSSQVKEGPYMMNGDAINRKSAIENIGPVNQSNLCTEIVQHASKEEISTCNLSALNLQKYVIGEIRDLSTDKDTIQKDIRDHFDFNKLGVMTASVVENINRMIDHNNYALDEHLPNGTVKSGIISKTNYRNRPMGIGVSGLYNVMTKLYIPFMSDYGFMVNKMIFACMYFNALVGSMKIAIKFGLDHYSNPKAGAYDTFRTGKWKCFNPITSSYEVKSGSPLSNGYFQFDLWRLEYEYLKYKNRLCEEFEGEELYKLENILPLNPSVWGQRSITIEYPEHNFSLEVPPTWNGLRELIKVYGVRNSQLMALMPTASTANIVSAVEAFELPISMIYVKRIKDVNNFYIVPEFVKKAKELGIMSKNYYDFVMACEGSTAYLPEFLERYPLRNPIPEEEVQRFTEVFKTAFEVSQKDTARMCQQRGIYVCQSQSFNVFMSNVTKDKLQRFHTFANGLGLKTGMYYLRAKPDTYINPQNIDPVIVNFAKEIIFEDHQDDEIQEEELVCTREAGCVACSV